MENNFFLFFHIGKVQYVCERKRQWNIEYLSTAGYKLDKNQSRLFCHDSA